MKAGQSISKSVLAFVVAGVAIICLLIWFGWQRQAPQPSEAGTWVSVESASPSVPKPAEIIPATPSVALPEAGLPPVVPVSLKNVPRGTGDWLTSRAFRAFPRGTQYFGGIEFWLDGVVILQYQAGLNQNQDYQTNVVVPLTKQNVFTKNGTQPGSNVASIHLVGATHFIGDKSPVADLVWHYTDGSSQQTPIRSDYHVRDYLRTHFETPVYLPYQFTKAVWRGDSVNQPGRKVRLYRVSFPNPEPSKVIRQLEFVSALQVAQLFVLGITLDPLAPGERPDDSPNLEPTDTTAAAQLDVYVQNLEGQPLPKATLHLRIQQEQEPYSRRYDQSVDTDSSGVARFNYPSPEKIDRVELSAMHDDYAGRNVSWSVDSGDLVPATWNFKLGAGVKIGGIVVDSSNVGIPGVKLSIHRFWHGGDEINQKGERPDVPSRTLMTDVQGNWQVKGLPAELLDRIMVEVRHPGYLNTTIPVRADDNTEKQLRAGTFKTVMRKGLEVQGRVTDEANSAISGASVWAGSRYTPERQNKKTDAEGRFSFRNISEGDLQFSVTAKSKKPQTKTVAVKPGMEEIVFRLGPGKLIRGLVQNETAEPLPGTRVSLENNSGGVAESYEFDTTTDKEGRFEWDGAPDEPVRFYFYKEGYEQKQGQQLKQDVDNVVTLRKSRQVEGWVLDATTEKPITKFRIGVGSYQGTDRFYANHPGMKDYADANGSFKLELNAEQKNGIKAEADDYSEKIEKLPEAQNGVIQVVLRLKPSAALRGVLLSPEGAPVAGGTVAFTSAGGGPGGRSVTLKNGRLSGSGSQNKIVTTDATGQFTLSSPPESGFVVGAAEMGFATAPIQQVRDSGRLVLQTYGSIEGTFKVGGQPVAGQDFMLSMMDAGINFERGSYKTTSDEAGRFNIEKVPPGQRQIVRLVKSGQGSWMHSHNTDVLIEPGKTTQVTLGDAGAVLMGHVSFESPPADGGKLIISGSLNTGPPNFQNPEQARAFYASPEGQELRKVMKHFSVAINADGNFTLDSIPSGTYILNIAAVKPGPQPWQGIPVAQGQMTVTVPEGANPFSPINIGEIILKPAR